MRRLLVLASILFACSSEDDDARSSSSGTGGFGDAPGTGGGAGVGGGDGGSPRHGQARAIGAMRAADFVDSIGVNVHLGYTDTPYWDFELVKSRLVELGVRHVRDGLPSPAALEVPDTITSRFKELGELGIRSTLIVGYEPSLPDLEADLPVRLGRAVELADSIAAIESTNEPDIQSDPDWISSSIVWQTALHDRLRNDPAFSALSKVPILAPSVVGDEAAQQLLAAAPNIGELVDFGNIHPYPGGLPPETNIHRAIGRSRSYLARIPVMATETGYHNALAATDGHPPVPEELQAFYLPRLHAEYVRTGVTRSFDYELIDELDDPALTNREAHFGLVRRDGTPKPAFTALANLIQLLSDPGTDWPPDAIQFWSSDRDVRQLVLEKEDGTFWILLWRNQSVWDTATQTAILPVATPVTLSFLTIPTSVVRYEPSVGLDAQPLPAGELDVTIDVGASLILLRVTGLPRGGDAYPKVVDELDDLSEFVDPTQVSIETTISRQYDFDDGLVVRDGDGATITTEFTPAYDFALRTYFFCQGCVDAPLEALTFESSGDGTGFEPIEMVVIDHQPTMDARETATFVPKEPLWSGPANIRVRLGPGAPLLGELTLFE
jgi:hypothetical protein